jgi:F-type H+-transporting ATPase subunit a
MIVSPLEQFEIVPVISFITGYKFAITNSTIFGFLATITMLLLLFFATMKSTVIPNRWQTIVESLYEFVCSFVADTLGKGGFRYFPFIFVTFCFILSCNLCGMVPYSFTITSHLIVTFGLGLSTFIGINVIAFRAHGLHFFSFFLPKEAPLALAPFLVMIEFISYIFRVMSLSIRLFANMMAGHTLLKILAGFGWTMLTMGGIFTVLHLFPLAIVVALTGLELGIAFLQAYVWSVLVCIYLNDAINLH